MVSQTLYRVIGIAGVNRQSSELQQQLANVTRDRTSSVEHLEQLTTAIQNAAVPAPEQKAIEFEISMLKTRIAEQQQEEQRLQIHFAEISRMISSEQGRWMDFNNRLDELERSLR